MGGWTDVRDGIVHGLHFYQKTIHLMFMHACMGMISEFDQGLFVGGVSELTHVHLERILFGVESRSDGVHWIHQKRIDSTGKVYFLFVRDLEKFPLVLYEGVESRSDGVHWIHRK